MSETKRVPPLSLDVHRGNGLEHLVVDLIMHACIEVSRWPWTIT